MYLWWVSQSCLCCLIFPFVASPAADSGERPMAALLGCRTVLAGFEPTPPPHSIPFHVSPCCPTCSSAAAAAALSRSRTSPSFFQPFTTLSTGLLPELQWTSQLVQSFSNSGFTSTSFSCPQSPLALDLCCCAEVLLATVFWNLNGDRVKTPMFVSVLTHVLGTDIH